MVGRSSAGCSSPGLASAATIEPSWLWPARCAKKKSCSCFHTGSWSSEWKGSGTAATCSASGHVAAFLSNQRRQGLRSCLGNLWHSCCPGSGTWEGESARGLSGQNAGAARSCFDSLRTRATRTLASGAASWKHDRTFFLHTCCMFLWRE